MKRWRPWFVLTLAAALTGLGCSHSTTVSLTIAPTSTTTLINNTVQFSPTETGSTAAVTWSVNGVAATATTLGGGPSPNGPYPLGTITSNGLYTAPSTVPTNPNVTITAAVSGTSTTTTATVDVLSGVQVSIPQAPSTIGTGESFVFNAVVTGVPANAVLTNPTTMAVICNSVNPNPPTVPACNTVTWKVSSGPGTIDANGNYTVPGSATPGTVNVTATSVYDINQISVAVFTVVAATDPTLISVGPSTGTRGAIFEDFYLSGTNFISTTNVFINGVQVPTSAITVSPVTCATLVTTNSGTTTPVAPCTTSSLTSGSTVLRVRVSDQFLGATFPTLPSTNSISLTFTAARQNGSQQACAPTPSQCQVVLSPQQPVVVGLNPSTVPLGGGGTFNFTVDGGFYGELGSTTPKPLVTAQFSGQAALPAVSSTNPDLQLNIQVAGSLASQPGLYQVSVTSDTTGLPPAVKNLAVQESYPSSPVASGTVAVGTKPWAIGINTATGLAVVANQTSNDVTLINLTATPPVAVASICTGGIGLSEPCPASPAAAPTGVAVDNIRNMALVVDSGTNLIAVVNLLTKQVTAVLNPATTINNSSIAQVPVAVALNPLTAEAIVVYRGTNFALLLNVANCPAGPPTISGIVNMVEGSNPRIAVSTRLNWALVSPGGLGSLDIVNLAQQSTNTIASATVSNGTVTVNTTAPHTLQTGETVLTSVGLVDVVGVATSTSFTYTQTTGVPTLPSGKIFYSVPLAEFAPSLTVTGVALDEESAQAVLVDPTDGNTQVSLFSLLDQSSGSVSSSANQGTSLQLPALGMIGAAFNPLDDIAVTVNQTNSTGYIINPAARTVVGTFTVGSNPWDLAIDPGTDTAVVINQGDNDVSIVPLGTLRTPQVLEVQTNCATSSDICGSADEIFVPSSLASAATPMGSVVFTVVGKGFDSSSTLFLDGTQFFPTSASDRIMTVTIPTAALTGPHRYALYVSNSDSGAISNATALRVIQSISVAGTGCASPTPTGVAVDAPNNLAVVTDSSCNEVYLVNLANGTGQIVAVGTTPLGVAVSPQGGSVAQGGIVAIANTGSDNVSLLDDITLQAQLIQTDANPTGVAIEPVVGQVVVAANGANTVDIFPTSSVKGATVTSTPVGQGPIAVAVDPILHIAAVANTTGNSVSLVPLVGSSSLTATSFAAQLPLGVVYEPITADFLVTSSLGNAVLIENPTTGNVTSIGVGINPTSIAYNFATGTLVTANSFGGNMTVVDFVTQQVRDVFPMSSSGVFSVAINPQTNLGVVADSNNTRILLVPLP